MTQLNEKVEMKGMICYLKGKGYYLLTLTLVIRPQKKRKNRLLIRDA